MKKLTVLLFSMFCFVFGSRADIIYPDGHVSQPTPRWVTKLSRGISNFFFAPMEVPKTLFDATEKYGVLNTRSFTEGVIDGFHNAGMRLLHGAHDMATFHEDTKQMYHLEPEYLNLMDAVPGYINQFEWETIDSPAFRLLQ